MTKREYYTYVIVMGLLTAIGPFSIDMYLPGFEDIAASLGTTAAKVTLSLSSFFVGVSVGQLLYGPLMDRYGRKKPLYAGLLLYIVATFICMETKEIHTLIVLRFIQAVGACGAQVAAMAMVRDLFGAEDSAKVFSLLLLVLGASPMIAPTAGAYIVSVWNWRIVFLVLLIMATLITVLAIFLLPESYPGQAIFVKAVADPAEFSCGATGASVHGLCDGRGIRFCGVARLCCWIAVALYGLFPFG